MYTNDGDEKVNFEIITSFVEKKAEHVKYSFGQTVYSIES